MRFPHLCIQAAARKKFAVRPFVVELSVFDDEDSVRVFDRRKTMRDDEQRFSFYKLCNRRLNNGFVFGIGVRRRFVEDDDGRVFKHGARDRDALPLAA